MKKPRLSRVHWLILFVSTSLFSIIFFLISDIAEATRNSSINPSLDLSMDGNLEQMATASIKMINLPLALPEFIKEEAKPIVEPLLKKAAFYQPKMKWQTLTIKRGDTLSKVFSRLQLDMKELHKIVALGDSTDKLNKIQPGEELKFLVVDDELHELIYEIDETNALHIERNQDTNNYIARTVTNELNKRIAHATAEIDSSLYLAAQKAGIPGSMTMQLANIFDWDVDFVLDVRPGDRFSVIYEEYFFDGEKVSNGNILAAEFINNKKVYRAVRYIDDNDHANYYTPEGKSMRKAFLRTPVDFTRISSKFGKRYHPILNRMRDHKGVDYVAPRGTPIKAAGEGKITHMGRKGGYGSTIIVQHGGRYTTLYAHLKGFKKGLRKGDRVEQGEIIGFVGKTGLATGPHLHYEFRVNGVHRNPLTVKLPGARPITSRYRTAFRLNTQGYLTLLDTLGKTRLALKSSNQ